MSAEDLHPRTLFDLDLRRRVFSDQEVLEVPAGTEYFWSWYAGTIRFGEPFKLRAIDGLPDYPAPGPESALWFSGGVESTYTLEHVRHLSPTLLAIEDFPVFVGPDRRNGQIHFICAAIAAGLGYRVTYLGVERDDLLLAHNRVAQSFVERSPLFLERWSSYQPDHRLTTLCGHLEKEEIIAWLVERGIPITGTCDRLRGGQWCGDCYKCFEAFYFAKAVGLDLGILLRRSCFDDMHGAYQRYVTSGFTDNFNNSYHRFARLQILYQVSFDPNRDCVV